MDLFPGKLSVILGNDRNIGLHINAQNIAQSKILLRMSLKLKDINKTNFSRMKHTHTALIITFSTI